MRHLPSLNGLRAFEVAARHGSFTAAAQELNVTQAAVSRAVRLLKERLGFPLFRRHANGLKFTDQGRAFQPGLTDAFNTIARAYRPCSGDVERFCAHGWRCAGVWFALVDSTPCGLQSYPP